MGNNQPKGVEDVCGNNPKRKIFGIHNEGLKLVSENINVNSGFNHNAFISNFGKGLKEYSFQKHRIHGISEDIFMKYMCKASSTLGGKLFQYFLIEEEILSQSKTTKAEKKDAEIQVLTYEGFVRQCSKLLDCLNDFRQVEYYVNVFACGREEILSGETDLLLQSSYEIVLFAQHISFSSDELLTAICRTIMHGKERVTCKFVYNWINQHCPRLLVGMHQYICHVLSVGCSAVEEESKIEKKNVETAALVSKSKIATLLPSLKWLLSCSLPFLYIERPSPPSPSTALAQTHNLLTKLMFASDVSHWVTLYSSDEHGLSTNRFKHHVFDYRGPTLLFITCEDNHLFCVAADEEWNESKNGFGKMDCMFLQLFPEYKIMERGFNMIYFNETWRGYPTGLQVGNDSRNRVLTIDERLDLVHFMKIPLKLLALEVWGCGSGQLRAIQMEFKNMTRKDAENRRKVPMDAEWKDNPDRHLLEMAGKESYVNYK